MRKTIITLIVMSAILIGVPVFGEGNGRGRFGRVKEDTSEKGEIIVFAVGSELIWAHNTVYNSHNRSLIYDGTSYLPLESVMTAYGGSAVISGENAVINFRGNEYSVPISDMKAYGDVYFIKTRQFCELLGIQFSWNDGIIGLSDLTPELTPEDVEFYKKTLAYTGAVDLYIEEQYVNADKLVTYSVEGGFYSEPQTVELTTNLRNADIYYTFDGSDPYPGAPNTFLYTKPVVIDASSGGNLIYTNFEGVVSEDFKYPKGDVLKAACLKAKAFDKDDYTNMSKMTVNTYYIGDNILERYGVRVISITTAPDKLFDPEEGVYTAKNSTQLSNWRESSAFMEVFDKEGNRVIDQPIGLRLNGAGTRVFQQKALRIYGRENGEYENGKKKKFKHDFFDGEVVDINGEVIDEYNRLILRNAGDDWKSYFCRDVLVQDICKNAGIDVQGYSLSVVFLNGEYWGVHQIRERYDDKYLEDHYKLNDNKDAVIVEIAVDPMLATLSEGDDADLEDFNAQAYFIINNDMSDSAMYAKAESYFDLGNLLDYYIFNVYFENVDWPQNNVKIWRNTNPENTHIDTRWRFLMTDGDTTCEDNGAIYARDMGSNSERAKKWKGKNAKGTLGYKLDDSECLLNLMMKSLLKNENFEIEFIRRYNDYLNTIFKPWNVTGHMDGIYNEMIHLRNEHIARYPASWANKNINDLKEWAEERPEKARKELGNYFGYKTLVNVTFKCNQEQGAIGVNAILIDETSRMGIENPYEFTAPYYKNVPVWMRIIPKAGYSLDYFTINGEAHSDMNFVFTPTAKTVVEVFFKENSNSQ